MTNTVTHETARRLAAAGFPQPAPAPGQWWGDDEMIVFLFRAWADGKHDFFLVEQSVADGRPIIDDYFDARDFTGLVYLPTVGDILRELPDATLYFSARSVYYKCSVGVDGMSWIEHKHEHPAESVALAYLGIHEKK